MNSGVILFELLLAPATIVSIVDGGHFNLVHTGR